MAFSSCFCYPQFSLKNDCSGLTIRSHHIVGKDRKLFSSLRSNSIELFGQRVARVGADLHRDWNFLGGSRIIVHPKLTNFLVYRKSSGVNASCRSCSFLECNPILARPPAVFYENISLAMGVRCLEQNYLLSEPRKPGPLLVHALSRIPTGTYGQAGTLLLSPLGSFLRDAWTKQIASSVFTLGTAAVLPFYTLMVVAPKAEVTRKSMESSIPYIVLGLLYAFLLYLSWTPDTMRLMFASEYWLPELPGIAKMFSNEMTLASAWIHLLAVDLFAARQVFNDGLENEVETRHSVSLCLLFCPIGIATHFITKALTKGSGTTTHDM